MPTLDAATATPPATVQATAAATVPANLPPDLIGDEDRAAHIADVLRAVAHPDRLRIVALLCQEPMHVNAIADALGKSQPIVSQQLRILRMQRLVAPVRQEGRVYYHLLEPQLRDLVRCVSGCHQR